MHTSVLHTVPYAFKFSIRPGWIENSDNIFFVSQVCNLNYTSIGLALQKFQNPCPQVDKIFDILLFKINSW